ncbi:MAG: zinc ABC transporter substrate-binding protein [Bacteroidota bacterium]|nr:zinc ABC transporter substrate-binding protein [Bacteroidota bacterium]
MNLLKLSALLIIMAVCHFIPSSSHGQTEGKKPLVVSSASMFADIAANIGGDLIETATIVPIGGDPHIYEPTPGDVQLIVKADLILQNGFTFEGWISELIKNSGTKATVVTITEGILPIVSPKHQNATDPHAWMEPLNGMIYAQNIRNAIRTLLPEHAEKINANFAAYVKQLEDLDIYIRDALAKVDTSKRILITSHDSFHYYGNRYGVRLESVLGTSTDADVRTSDLVRLNEIIQTFKIPVVFIESTINPKLLQQVAADNKIKIGGKLYSDSLGDKNSPADTYINLIKQNTDVIVNGLLGNSPAASDTSGATKGTSKWFIILGVVFLLGILLIWVFRRKNKTA